jgi:hypothetical protein
MSAGLKLRASFSGEGIRQAPLRKKTETDRICEGIFERFYSTKPKRVALGSVGAVPPRHRVYLNKSFQVC